MFRIQFGDEIIYSRSRFRILFSCFRFLKRQVPSGFIIQIFKF